MMQGRVGDLPEVALTVLAALGAILASYVAGRITSLLVRNLWPFARINVRSAATSRYKEARIPALPANARRRLPLH